MNNRDYLQAVTSTVKTENGDTAYSSTMNHNLDLFSIQGALRSDEIKLYHLFKDAYKEDKALALKNIFYLRSVRGGLGERKLFRLCFNRLCSAKPSLATALFPYIVSNGRWDDLFSAFNTASEKPMMEYVQSQFYKDLKNLSDNKPVSLLGKWMPSINTSKKETRVMGRRFANFFGMNLKEYRQALSSLRKNRIIENSLRVKDYTFDYEKIPALAMHFYNRTFMLRDEVRFSEYIASVNKGEKKINASILYPYQILREGIISRSSLGWQSAQAKWISLPRKEKKKQHHHCQRWLWLYDLEWQFAF